MEHKYSGLADATGQRRILDEDASDKALERLDPRARGKVVHPDAADHEAREQTVRLDGVHHSVHVAIIGDLRKSGNGGPSTAPSVPTIKTANVRWAAEQNFDVVSPTAEDPQVGDR